MTLPPVQTQPFVFLSHASEDTDDVARPLAQALTRMGISVWLDEFVLTVGDSLRREIDRGLAQSQFGIVILSPAFFAKEWPRRELDALFAKDDGATKVVLPVWHNMSAKQIQQYSPTLADLLAVSTKQGIDSVAHEILRAIRRSSAQIPFQTTEPVRENSEQVQEPQGYKVESRARGSTAYTGDFPTLT